MRHSIVIRLTVIVALIIAASFLALQAVNYRSTSEAFVRSEEALLPRVIDTQRINAVATILEDAYTKGGLAAIHALAEDPRRFDAGPDLAFLLVDPDLKVRVSTESLFIGAKAQLDSRTGAMRILASDDEGGSVTKVDFTALSPRRLTSASGAGFGALVMLPEPLNKKAGDEFASSVWHSMIAWLSTVLVLAMIATAGVMRRSLAPIDVLTRAARKLQQGEIPAPVEYQSGNEFSPLVEAFNSAAGAIERTETLRRTLISDIAHELRTPVTNLKGQLEALETGLIKPNKDFVTTLQAETRLLERLVEDFQQIAISDAGNLKVYLQDLPLKELIEAIVAPIAQNIGASLHIDIPDHVVVYADEERMHQVLMNLVENSARHKPKDLEISVVARFDGRNVTMLFSDNGPGVARHDQAHIFERFFRAEKSRNRASGGAGLGLTIVKGIIEAMGGAVQYVHTTEPGAVFSIVLPDSSRGSA